jgi:hypothetical protein
MVTKTFRFVTQEWGGIEVFVNDHGKFTRKPLRTKAGGILSCLWI